MGLGQCKGARKSDEVLSLYLHFYLLIVSSFINPRERIGFGTAGKISSGIYPSVFVISHEDSGLRGKMEAGWARMNGDHSLKHDVNQF